MKKLRGRLTKCLLILISCLSVGIVSSAAGGATTDVQIAIEKTEIEEAREPMDSVKTGDRQSMTGYLLGLGLAVVAGAVCIWKKKKKGILVSVMLLLSLVFTNQSLLAAESTENINVTIPSGISVSFEQSGQTTVSEFSIYNQSLVPITIEKINVTEQNNWKLCEKGSKIPADTKTFSFEIENQCLKAKDNAVSIPIEENTSRTLDIQIERGAWSKDSASETAMHLEFEYELGTKEFQLSFDTNGSDETIAARGVYNGSTVELPSLTREGYEFAGWEDSEGNLYTDEFVMPIGHTTLKAKWSEIVGYALYFAEDYSLRFVRSAEPIVAGSTYDGRVVTAAYTGFEKETYSSETQVPWYDQNDYQTNVVKQVIFEEKIQPLSTAYWFCYMRDCEKFDLNNLDTSNVTDMSYMFAWAGFNVSNFQIDGVSNFNVSKVGNMSYMFAYMARDASSLVMNLMNWNVLRVTNMSYMFAGTGYNAKTFNLGTLGIWRVSNVTNMDAMFKETGYRANWYMYLRDWDVKKVTTHVNFNQGVSSKVLAPRW